MPGLIQYWMDKIEEFKESDLLFSSTKWILIHIPNGIISYFAIMTLILYNWDKWPAILEKEWF